MPSIEQTVLSNTVSIQAESTVWADSYFTMSIVIQWLHRKSFLHMHLIRTA